MTIKDRHLMTAISLILEGHKIDMLWEPQLMHEFDRWRADRRLWGRRDAIRRAIRWVAAHDTTGRQRPVQPDDPVLAQLDAFRDANGLIARTEAVKLAVLTMLRQPAPDGNARRVRPTAPVAAKPAPAQSVIRLVVDNAQTNDSPGC